MQSTASELSVTRPTQASIQHEHGIIHTYIITVTCCINMIYTTVLELWCKIKCDPVFEYVNHGLKRLAWNREAVTIIKHKNVRWFYGSPKHFLAGPPSMVTRQKTWSEKNGKMAKKNCQTPPNYAHLEYGLLLLPVIGPDFIEKSYQSHLLDSLCEILM